MLKYGGKLRQVVGKYGRVAVGVHLTVSGLCFTGCYAAILSSVDVESMLERVGLGSWLPPHDPSPSPSTTPTASTSLPGGGAGTPGALPAPAHPSGLPQGTPGAFPAGPAAQMYGLHGPVDGAQQSRQAEGGAGVYQGGNSSVSGGVGEGVEGEGVVGVGEEKGQWSLVKGGGAFAIAWLCNKALFPVRLPITIGLTPPVWRFLASKGFRV